EQGAAPATPSGRCRLESARGVADSCVRAQSSSVSSSRDKDGLARWLWGAARVERPENPQFAKAPWHRPWRRPATSTPPRRRSIPLRLLEADAAPTRLA